MRSRSSRLFIVLLSLVGVSTNIPHPHGSHRGIVGVNPMAILLERLELQEFDDGLDGLLRQAGQAAQDLLLEEPYWLQDDYDGKCFGPAGFSECGDATLWQVRRHPQWKRGLLKRMLMPYDIEQKDWGYALQLVDANDDDSPLGKSRDCLVRNKKRGLGLGKCTSLETAWSWRVSGEGILFHGGKRLRPSQCLWRTNVTRPILSSCEADEEDSSSRLVRFSMVRYHTSSKSDTVERVLQEDNNVRQQQQQQQVRIKEEKQKRQQAQEEEPKHHPVTSVDLAHSHASEPLMHPDLKPSSQLLFAPITSKQQAAMVPRNILKGASPILFALDERDAEIPVSPPTEQVKRLAPVKLRKMPTHPYIAAAKDNIWTDPQTSLEFRTDLCEYLGHDRKESGRHTLTGVGQYTRTVFNIKIYGVALYVSKRDVLADPLFEPFSSLSQEELRERPDFYSHLRHMPSPLDERGGLFDRTLLLKLNMQLSTDTMRSSLQGDWKMLNEEMASLLINSSLKPRPANEKMLGTIQNEEENPGKCSCGQVAPEEYGADPSCCARGTELGFTWRKNGDVEIRLDGRLMDAFPRPDIAAGIFFDYLRDDDPISADFLNNLVHGFPFLLAPLSQVKGVSSGIMSSGGSEGRHEAAERAFFRAVGGFADMVSSRTEDVSEWLHGNANAMASRMHNVAQSAGGTARNIAEEMDRRREMFVRQAESSFQFVASRIHPNRRALSAMAGMRGLGSKTSTDFLSEQEEEERLRKPAPRGRVFGRPLTKWLGESQEATLPDEIGPMIHPTMNFTRKVFWGLVHMYLMLLLIVSLPGSPNTRRTKLVVRRNKLRKVRCKEVDENDSIGIIRKSKEGDKRVDGKSDDCKGGGKIKKSLSYFL